MLYDFTALPDAEVPVGIEPAFRHTVTTYASEVNKTVGVWRAVPDALLDFKPHERVNTIRTILVHQLLSERRFFAEFAGLEEPSVEELLPGGDAPAVQRYIDKYVWLARRRLPQFAAGTVAWWLEPRRFFGGEQRARGCGCSGGGSCTPATTGPRCRRGCAWPGTSRSRRSTGRRAT